MKLQKVVDKNAPRKKIFDNQEKRLLEVKPKLMAFKLYAFLIVSALIEKPGLNAKNDEIIDSIETICLAISEISTSVFNVLSLKNQEMVALVESRIVEMVCASWEGDTELSTTKIGESLLMFIKKSTPDPRTVFEDGQRAPNEAIILGCSLACSFLVFQRLSSLNDTAMKMLIGDRDLKDFIELMKNELDMQSNDVLDKIIREDLDVNQEAYLKGAVLKIIGPIYNNYISSEMKLQWNMIKQFSKEDRVDYFNRAIKSKNGLLFNAVKEQIEATIEAIFPDVDKKNTNRAPIIYSKDNNLVTLKNSLSSAKNTTMPIVKGLIEEPGMTSGSTKISQAIEIISGHIRDLVDNASEELKLNQNDYINSLLSSSAVELVSQIWREKKGNIDIKMVTNIYVAIISNIGDLSTTSQSSIPEKTEVALLTSQSVSLSMSVFNRLVSLNGAAREMLIGRQDLGDFINDFRESLEGNTDWIAKSLAYSAITDREMFITKKSILSTLGPIYNGAFMTEQTKLWNEIQNLSKHERKELHAEAVKNEKGFLYTESMNAINSSIELIYPSIDNKNRLQVTHDNDFF